MKQSEVVPHLSHHCLSSAWRTIQQNAFRVFQQAPVEYVTMQQRSLNLRHLQSVSAILVILECLQMCTAHAAYQTFKDVVQPTNVIYSSFYAIGLHNHVHSHLCTILQIVLLMQHRSRLLGTVFGIGHTNSCAVTSSPRRKPSRCSTCLAFFAVCTSGKYGVNLAIHETNDCCLTVSWG